MAAATDDPEHSTIKATILLTVMLLACSITGVKSQTGLGDIACYVKCGTDIGQCWPKCTLTGPLIAQCMTNCISDGIQCIFECTKKPDAPLLINQCDRVPGNTGKQQKHGSGLP
ncbi:hypothetical protein AQUCO_11500009v1 [Aquilegia coerulea]|uniref:Bifunctional inhibitor/plant lipid transfer protein/seed storage helical domain-containing protein n=1 Tax=Aquilegia coerulea TaxID=218851 RepID=A0A2G5C2A1_AQUCA|nr:hypothetical protein AQUCO_11500009v1 [Aquilegia coerulea]